MLNNRTQQRASVAAAVVAGAAGRAVEPYVGHAANQHMSAPAAATQGAAVSAAGSFAGQLRKDSAVALIDLPGSHPPRQAPV
ncbi:MAG: hypothetical protein NVSMB55_24490 [Mycobacteriales bacterium]